VTGDVLYLGAVGLLEDLPVYLAILADLVGVDDREVGVDPQGAVPAAVEHAEVLEDRLQFRQERPDLVRTPEVRPGDDLHQRGPGAVVVDQRVVRAVDRGGPALDGAPTVGDVQQASGVLLEVGPTDPDRAALAVDRHLQFAVLADRCAVLGDLEVLREVRVVVVLPVERGRLRNLGVDCLPDFHRGLDGALVEDGESSRQPQTDGAGQRVRVGVAGVGRTATEYLRVRLQLDVDLQPDHDREVLLDGLSGHWTEFGVVRVKATVPPP